MTVKCGSVVNYQLPGNRFKPQPCFRKFCANFGGDLWLVSLWLVNLWLVNLWLVNLWPMLWLSHLGSVAGSARKLDPPGSELGSVSVSGSWHEKETLCTWNSTHQDQEWLHNLVTELKQTVWVRGEVLLAVPSYWHCLLENNSLYWCAHQWQPQMTLLVAM